MKTTKKSVRFIALVLVLIMLASDSPLSAAALNKSVPAESTGHTLVMQSDHLTVARKKTIQMTATVTNVDEQPVIYWASSDESIATVDHNGVARVTVINQIGSELPSTGGRGTTMFYILGGVLVLAAVVLLVARKRMSAHA